MMALSRPLYDFLGFYLSELFNNPIRTKAVSSCVISAAGNLTSQYVSGCKQINYDSVAIYGLYGLVFGGTIPHYFYMWLSRTVRHHGNFAILQQLLIERLIYCPLYNVFALYILARMEGKTHDASVKQLEQIYWPILSANWKYLTLIQFLNLKYVPPMLRVLVVNLVGFFWVIFLARKRRLANEKRIGSSSL